MSTVPGATHLPAYLVRGADDVAVAEAVRALIAHLVGGSDPSLVVEDLSSDDYPVRDIVDAAQTPPFFSDRRVVVARGAGRFSTAELAPLLAYLANPMPTTSLVVVGGGGQLARSLVDAVRKAGRVVDADPPSGKARAPWLAEKLRHSPVRLDPAATALVSDHLGEDLSRLRALLELLAAAHGPGSRLGPEQVAPFLGERGAVAPWELTDAIDRGDTAAAVDQVRRQMGPGGRHPLVVLASLSNHFTRMLRLEGDPDVTDERAAAAALGLTGSTFPARKALLQVRRIGHDGVDRAVTLLAEADLALKGTIDWPPEVVMEVLVARLSGLARRAATGAAGVRPAAPTRSGR